MRIHLVNPSDLSFGTAVITPRWLYVLAAATPERYGTPVIVDETIDPFDLDTVAPGDVVGIGIHTGNALRGYELGRLARERGAPRNILVPALRKVLSSPARGRENPRSVPSSLPPRGDPSDTTRAISQTAARGLWQGIRRLLRQAHHRAAVLQREGMDENRLRSRAYPRYVRG